MFLFGGTVIGSRTTQLVMGAAQNEVSRERLILKSCNQRRTENIARLESNHIPWNSKLRKTFTLWTDVDPIGMMNRQFRLRVPK